jgi:hypothetical protein
MAGAIATLLTTAKTISKVATDMRANLRHTYNELVALQGLGDPTLAAPYLKASHVETIPAHLDTIASGNFTVTINFPNYGVAVTTGNIAFDAAEAAIQTAIDTALDTQVIVATYNAGDVDVALTGNLTENAATITANGATVNGAYMLVTTANAGDLDADELATPVAATVGTMNRPAEAILAIYNCITPAAAVTPQGLTPAVADYVTGDNPLSISPALKALLISEVEASENAVLGAALRAIPDCVE